MSTFGSIGKFAQDVAKGQEAITQGAVISQPNYSYLGAIRRRQWVMRRPAWGQKRSKGTMTSEGITERIRALYYPRYLRDTDQGFSRTASDITDRAMVLRGSTPAAPGPLNTRGFAKSYKKRVMQKLGIIASPDLAYTVRTEEPGWLQRVETFAFADVPVGLSATTRTYGGRTGLGFMDSNLIGNDVAKGALIGAGAVAALVGAGLWLKYRHDQANATALDAQHQEMLGKAIAAQAQGDYGAQQEAMGRAILLEAQALQAAKQADTTASQLVQVAANKGKALTKSDLLSAAAEQGGLGPMSTATLAIIAAGALAAGIAVMYFTRK